MPLNNPGGGSGGSGDATSIQSRAVSAATPADGNTLVWVSANSDWEPGVGAAGNTLLNGTGAPSSGLGNDGDEYLDTAAETLYGPKASGAWPAGVPLIGASGATSNQELGYAQTTTTATGTNLFTAPAAVAGMSVTVTVGTRPILLKAEADTPNNSAGSGHGVCFWYRMDGGSWNVLGQTFSPAANQGVAPFHREVRLTPSAGSHTFDIGCSNVLFDASGGTWKVPTTSSDPFWMQVVEL